MERKRIRWAASIYNLGVTELRGVAERILRSSGIEGNTVFRWPVGTRDRLQHLEVVENTPERGVYTDGSRLDGRTAAATITSPTFVGRYATVMDAEMLAIAMGWQLGSAVSTDSQAVIGNLQLDPPKGWIEEKLVRAAKGEVRLHGSKVTAQCWETN